MDLDITRAIGGAGVVARREYPELGRRLAHLCERDELVTLLPGVYALPQLATDWETRAVAACLFDSSAVIVGDAAAALTYWPDLEPEVIEVAGRRTTVRRPGFDFVKRQIPRALIHSRWGLRFSTPDLTALDQVARRGGDGIDRALRTRQATLAGMHEALDLTRNRHGNSDRRVMLLDSRDEPWSALERLAHRLLRDAGIAGWSTNVQVDTAGGTYYLDIAFESSPLCIELDGREFHGIERFDDDRKRGNDLLLAGKQVLHFTWWMLTEQPAMVLSTIRRAQAQLV